MPFLLQPRVIGVELVQRHVEGDVIHRAVRGHHRTLGRQIGRARDAGRGFWSVGEPEEGERIAIADVEKEVLAEPAGQIDRLDQRHAE